MSKIDWDGLLAGFDKNNKRIFFTIQDARETETPYMNSASSWTDIAFDYVNLNDDKYHYLMFGWASTGSNILNTPQDIVRKGLIGVDNFIFYPKDNGNSTSGKSTTLSFIYDKSKATSWTFGGYQSTRASTTAKTKNFDMTKCFNGEIKDITIWDTLLSGTATLNNSSLVQDDVGGTWGYAARGDNPLTSSTLCSYSANVVAFFDSTTASMGASLVRDQAGSLSSGLQSNPTTGNTLYLVGPNSNLFGLWDYLLYDISQNNSTLNFPNGLIQFLDENGNINNIGTIFYDLGIIILDNEYVTGSNSGLPFINTISTSGMGYSNLTGFNVHYINFDSVNKFQRLTINAKAESDEFNYTQNVTGVISQSGEQLLSKNQGTYPTTVGLYNSLDELIAIAKMNKPERKDEDHTINVNVNLDF